jgi:hypothetical protein
MLCYVMGGICKLFKQTSPYLSTITHLLPRRPVSVTAATDSRSGGWSPAGTTRHGGYWLAHCTCPGWFCRWRIWRNEGWQGKPKYSEKVRPSATLSTTNPPWQHPESYPGCRVGKPATNRLSYGAARCYRYYRRTSANDTALFCLCLSPGI